MDAVDDETRWHALAEQARGCRDCPIGLLGTRMVWGEGPLRPALMLVGEQPGDQEDHQGRPFVGPAGRLLDRALAQLQWPRERLYVTNAVKHFKFEWRGQRRLHKTPAQREAAICAQWLQGELDTVRPGAIVALGATAARALLGPQATVSGLRGRWTTRPADGLPVLVTLHPSALLRLHAGEREPAYVRWLDDLKLASDRLVAGGRPDTGAALKLTNEKGGGP
ncbi:UdgX family uracil-DNA binding protein [Aquabacterium sp. J223]|uniref:UdgX family uracil-DNA binding protein n=1 Tax=Aquabacterium sp. J223 TaxID=2898431 RepID=UPI0021AD73F4|nr:UdgX family uracil-DNA binding protein [Aquabacterium sp. J223]UUX96203.1 UdgX family uracil-DNA binding protein [Aquabacterium sp. J223]